MDYDQIDALDKGVVWQGGAVDDAIDSPPFAGPLLGGLHGPGRGERSVINHRVVEVALAGSIDDVPAGVLKDQVLTSLADAIVAWLNDVGNVYLHRRQEGEPGQLHRRRPS